MAEAKPAMLLAGASPTQVRLRSSAARWPRSRSSTTQSHGSKSPHSLQTPASAGHHSSAPAFADNQSALRSNHVALPALVPPASSRQHPQEALYMRAQATMAESAERLPPDHDLYPHPHTTPHRTCRRLRLVYSPKSSRHREPMPLATPPASSLHPQATGSPRCSAGSEYSTRAPRRHPMRSQRGTRYPSPERPSAPHSHGFAPVLLCASPPEAPPTSSARCGRSPPRPRGYAQPAASAFLAWRLCAERTFQPPTSSAPSVALSERCSAALFALQIFAAPHWL